MSVDWAAAGAASDAPVVTLGPDGTLVPNPDHPVGAELGRLLAGGGEEAEVAAAQLALLNAGVAAVRRLEQEQAGSSVRGDRAAGPVLRLGGTGVGLRGGRHPLVAVVVGAVFTVTGLLPMLAEGWGEDALLQLLFVGVGAVTVTWGLWQWRRVRDGAGREAG